MSRARAHRTIPVQNLMVVLYVERPLLTSFFFSQEKNKTKYFQIDQIEKSTEISERMINREKK